MWLYWAFLWVLVKLNLPRSKKTSLFKQNSVFQSKHLIWNKKTWSESKKLDFPAFWLSAVGWNSAQKKPGVWLKKVEIMCSGQFLSCLKVHIIGRIVKSHWGGCKLGEKGGWFCYIAPFSVSNLQPLQQDFNIPQWIGTLR